MFEIETRNQHQKDKSNGNLQVNTIVNVRIEYMYLRQVKIFKYLHYQRITEGNNKNEIRVRMQHARGCSE